MTDTLVHKGFYSPEYRTLCRHMFRRKNINDNEPE